MSAPSAPAAPIAGVSAPAAAGGGAAPGGFVAPVAVMTAPTTGGVNAPPAPFIAPVAVMLAPTTLGANPASGANPILGLGVAPPPGSGPPPLTFAIPLSPAKAEALRSKVKYLFENNDFGKHNFYYTMTHDACFIRHAMVDPNNLRKAMPLDNGRHPDFGDIVQGVQGNMLLSTPAQAIDPRLFKFVGKGKKAKKVKRGPLGRFHRLPDEINAMIFGQMDLETLTKFRSVSKGARAIIDGLASYKGIITHAPQILRAALSLQTARWTTLNQLDWALMSNVCQECGDFGALLHLLTCERLCHLCFARSNTRMPMTVNRANMKWNIAKGSLEAEPNNKLALTVPGYYKRGNRKFSRINLINPEAAFQVAMRVSGRSREEVVRYVSLLPLTALLIKSNTL
jgi:hypothetical protein